MGREAVPGPSNLTSGDSRLLLKDSDTAEERGEPRVAVGERGCHARRCRQVQPDLGGGDAANFDVCTRVKEGGNQLIANAPGVAPFGGRQRHVVGDLEGFLEMVEEAGLFFRLRLHGRHLRFTFPVSAADLAVKDPHGRNCSRARRPMRRQAGCLEGAAGYGGVVEAGGRGEAGGGLDSLHSPVLPVHVAPQARGDRP